MIINWVIPCIFDEVVDEIQIQQKSIPWILNELGDPKFELSAFDLLHNQISNPDSKVHGANMGPIWVLLAPKGPNVGHMNLDIWEVWYMYTQMGVPSGWSGTKTSTF